MFESQRLAAEIRRIDLSNDLFCTLKPDPPNGSGVGA